MLNTSYFTTAVQLMLKIYCANDAYELYVIIMDYWYNTKFFIV